MVDNETLYQLNIPSLFQKNPVFHSFITQEISKKIELVTHLVENTAESLIILGPQGVGKSTLISILQKQHKDSWIYANIKATEILTFENIKERIIEFTDNRHFNTQHKPALLVIDDAINLHAGLINSILSFVSSTKLKMIFLMTNEEYEAKCMTDTLLNECNLIEVLPLTKKQCIDFLQFLSPTNASNYVDYEENKIDEIYTATQGLPGKIIELLPSSHDWKESNKALFVLLTAVISLIAIALVTQLVTDPTIKSELPVIKSSISNLNVPAQ